LHRHPSGGNGVPFQGPLSPFSSRAKREERKKKRKKEKKKKKERREKKKEKNVPLLLRQLLSIDLNTLMEFMKNDLFERFH